MKIQRVKTSYWNPGTEYSDEICSNVARKVKSGDILLISEKAVATALGNIVDEEKLHPTLSAKIIACFWMRYIWGYFLGYICRLKNSTIQRLKNYPLVEGAKHKQLALQNFGLFQALRFGSEGGIDTSNLPYSYVSIPIPDPELHAKKICEKIKKDTGKDIIVLLVDSDKTYSFRRLHLSPTNSSLPRLFCRGGFILYMIGRLFKFKPRATPLAVYPRNALSTEEALNIAELSHHVMGAGAGKTAWDMAEKFKSSLTGVTWDMLTEINHYPIAIVRS